MSHTLHPMRTPRLQRSELAVPGSNTTFIDKAVGSARRLRLPRPGGRGRAAGEGAGPQERGRRTERHRLGRQGQDGVGADQRAGHALHVPRRRRRHGAGRRPACTRSWCRRSGCQRTCTWSRRWSTRSSRRRGYRTRVGIEALIETALGMANVEAIAASATSRDSRLEALHFGVADYAASNRARTVSIGGLNPDYPGDQWHFALSRMIVACRAYGLRPIDGPFGDFSDPDGYRAGGAAGRGARRARASGPSTPARSSWPTRCSARRRPRSTGPGGSSPRCARREAEGRGAASVDGKMIDAASERMARNVHRAGRGDPGRPGSPSGGRMDIHEYQAKEILARFGVPVPRGGLAYSPEQASYRCAGARRRGLGGQGAGAHRRAGRGRRGEGLPLRPRGAATRRTSCSAAGW